MTGGLLTRNGWVLRNWWNCRFLFVCFWWIWMVTPNLEKFASFDEWGPTWKDHRCKNEHSLPVAGHLLATFLPVWVHKNVDCCWSGSLLSFFYRRWGRLAFEMIMCFGFRWSLTCTCTVSVSSGQINKVDYWAASDEIMTWPALARIIWRLVCLLWESHSIMSSDDDLSRAMGFSHEMNYLQTSNCNVPSTDTKRWRRRSIWYSCLRLEVASFVSSTFVRIYLTASCLFCDDHDLSEIFFW